MPHGHCHHEHHDHDHSSSDELGIQYNLYEKIDKDNVQCLNESVEGSGKTVFKPWERRLDRTDVSLVVLVGSYLQVQIRFLLPFTCRFFQFVESDADEELLFNIPFTGNVKLKGIKIVSEETDAHPAKLRL